MIPSYFRLFILALITTILVLTVKKQTPELGLLLSIAGVILAILLLFQWLTPIIELIRHLCDSAGLDDTMTGPLIKIIGIGLLTQLSSSVCSDAGQTSMAKLLELGGGLLCLYLSIPLLNAVLSLIEDLL